MNFRKCKICYKIYGEVPENPSKNVELQKEARERRRKLLDFYNNNLSSQLCGLQLQNISRRKKRLQFCTVCTETIQKIYNLDEKCKSLQDIRGMNENLESMKNEVKELVERFTMKVLRVRKFVNSLQTIPGLNGVVENDSSQSSTSGEEETSDDSDDDCVLITEVIAPGSLVDAEISGLNPELENNYVKVQSPLNENEVNKKSVKETAPFATNTKDNGISISGLTVESSAKTNVEVMQNNCSGGENSSNHVELVMISSRPIQETTSPIDIHESPEINGKGKKTHSMERLEDGSLCTRGESGDGDLNSSSRHLQETFALDSSDIQKSPNLNYTEMEAPTSTSAASYGCNSPDIQMTTANLSEENVGNNPIMRFSMEFLIDNNKEVICTGIKESTPGIQMNCEGFEMDLGLTPQPAINIKNMKELQENSSFGESDNDLINSGESLAVVETPTLNIQKCPKLNNAKMKESVKSGIEALQVTFAGEMIHEIADDPYSQILSPDESQEDACGSGGLDCGEPISPEIEIDQTFYLTEEMLLDTYETVEIEYCEDAHYMQNRDAEGSMDCNESSNLTEDNVNNRDIEEDADCQIALEEIDKYQKEVDGLNDQASEEILKTEQKFNQLRKPLYNKRADVIRKIPNFWVTAMVNHPQISVLINEDEEDCLQHLHALEVVEFEDIKLNRYQIKFSFEKNAFFENDVLVKELHNMGHADGNVSTSTEIRWKKNMNLCKEQGDVTISNAGTRKHHLENKSFFLWFNNHSDPVGDEIAELIKNELWPNPLQYYLVPGGVEWSSDEKRVKKRKKDLMVRLRKGTNLKIARKKVLSKTAIRKTSSR